MNQTAHSGRYSFFGVLDVVRLCSKSLKHLNGERMESTGQRGANAQRTKLILHRNSSTKYISVENVPQKLCSADFSVPPLACYALLHFWRARASAHTHIQFIANMKLIFFRHSKIGFYSHSSHDTRTIHLAGPASRTSGNPFVPHAVTEV